MEDIEKKLKLKINKQIDKLEEQNEEIGQLKRQIESLQDEKLELIQKAKTVSQESSFKLDAAWVAALNDEIVVFFSNLTTIVKKIHENGQFIPYKNATKYSGSFCKVERNIFEGYVSEIAQDSQEFLKKCAGFLCIKSEGGKCVFNNDKIRVYFLNRQIVNVMLGCSASGADAPDTKVI